MTATTVRSRRVGVQDVFAGKLAYEASPEELKDALERAPEGVFIVDIRRRQSFDAGHIPGARNVPLEEIPAVFAALPKDRTIIAYCGDIACGQALRAALELAQHGFRVMSLTGGLEEWRRRGYPVESTPPPPSPEF